MRGRGSRPHLGAAGSAGRGVTRRELLGMGGAALGGLALAPALAGPVGAALRSGGGGKLTVSNWPLYIDEKTVKDFERTSGIDTKYIENINDNNEMFAKIQEPLSRNQGIGADIIVPTGWMANRLIKLGYLQPLPLDDIPNAANLVPRLQNASWDPTGKWSLPWQSYIGGIAYNIAKTDRELTSMDDLFDKKFKGKIGFLLEMRDSVGLMLLNEGIDPSTVTYRQAQPSFRRIERAAGNGQIRRFTGNDYQDDLVSGNFYACVGWSGDVAQLALSNDDLRFLVPEAGGTLAADTMVVVKPSKRAAQAAEWMNYIYDPVNAARITEAIQYLSPVAGIETELAKLDPELATSPYVFPPPEVDARVHQFRLLGPKEEERFDSRWSDITIGAGGPG